MRRDGTDIGHGLLVVNAERKRKIKGEESDGAHGRKKNPKLFVLWKFLRRRNYTTSGKNIWGWHPSKRNHSNRKSKTKTPSGGEGKNIL